MNIKNTPKAILAGIFALLIYLLFANSLACLFIPANVKPQKVNFDKFITNGKIYGQLEDAQYAQDNMETMQFKGWAFCPSYSQDGQKEIRVIFKSERGCYRSQPAQLYGNMDAAIYFADENAGVENSFMVIVSTLPLPNDAYDVFIEIGQNGEQGVLLNTGRSFKKNGRSMKDVTVAREGEVHNAVVSQIMQGELAMITKTENGLSLTGWVYLEGERASEQNELYAQLQIDDGTVRWFSLLEQHSFLNVTLKGKPVLRSTFNTTLPGKDLWQSAVSVSIVVKRNDIYYVSPVLQGYSPLDT